MDSLNSIVGLVGSVFSGGTVGIVLKLVLVLALVSGVAFLLNWIDRQKIAQATKATGEGREKDQIAIAKPNQDITQDGRRGEDDIEKIIDLRKRQGP